MLRPRWIKVLRDASVTRGRIAMMVVAIAAGVCGLATMLSSYTLLTREVARSYMETHPASASLVLDDADNVDAALLADVRKQPGIFAAQATARSSARVEVKPGTWFFMPLFVIHDFNEMRINTLFHDAGAWPPPLGTILLERDAMGLAGAQIGKSLHLKMRDGTERFVSVSGTAHDPGLPPASAGTNVYAFASPKTMAALGQGLTLHTLQILVRDDAMNSASIEKTAGALAIWLGQHGHPVKTIYIPPPGEHPHQRIMTSLITMLLLFSAMALVLSAILSATMFNNMLAQQVRQIGVMKALGARQVQIAAMYLLLVLVVAICATAVGVPLGLAGGRIFSKVVLVQILNFSMADDSVPIWALCLLWTSGILIPVVAACIPVRYATKISVRDALDSEGIVRPQSDSGRLNSLLLKMPALDRGLLLAVRSTFRRRQRLVFTLVLMSFAGAMFVGSLNVKRASEQHLIDAAGDRHYDLEIILRRAESDKEIARIVGQVAGVRKVEPWESVPAAKSRADGLVVERTYPDGAHNNLMLSAVPQSSDYIRLLMLNGRWLQAEDTDGVVLNHTALDFFPGIKVGDTIELTVRGKPVSLHLVGIARQYMVGATVYISQRGFSSVALPGRASKYRISLLNHDAAYIDRVTAQIEHALEKENIGVGLSVTETMLRKDVDGHFGILISAMLFVSALMACVGGLGLMSAMGNNVSERRREFGVMRAIGATPNVVLRNVIAEGLFIGLMSWGLAIALCIPLSVALDAFLGNMLFGLAFPFTMSYFAAGVWLFLVITGSIVASAYPAWKASRLSIRETIAFS